MISFRTSRTEALTGKRKTFVNEGLVGFVVSSILILRDTSAIGMMCVFVLENDKTIQECDEPCGCKQKKENELGTTPFQSTESLHLIVKKRQNKHTLVIVVVDYMKKWSYFR
jgi:hypothetical protein